jgi:hypothetical protein
MFTKFNRVLLASGLVLTSLVGFGSSAFAQAIGVDNTDYVTWQFVAEDNPVLAHTSANGAVSVYEGLPDTTPIGILTIASNGQFGFTVKVNGPESNTSSLVHTTMPDYAIPFKLGYGITATAAAYELTDSATMITGGQEDFRNDQDTCADADGCDRIITIFIDGDDLQTKPSGTYTQTVTFTVENDAS